MSRNKVETRPVRHPSDPIFDVQKLCDSNGIHRTPITFVTLVYGKRYRLVRTQGHGARIRRLKEPPTRTRISIWTIQFLDVATRRLVRPSRSFSHYGKKEISSRCLAIRARARECLSSAILGNRTARSMRWL